MRAVSFLALAIAAGVFSASCAKGPAYTKPAPTAQAQSVPESFKEAEGWKSAQPADQALRGAWWESFGEATLSQLEAQISIYRAELLLKSFCLARPR